ncbi:MAG: carboxypeptidase regulatory-like domain-containing protein [Methanobacteriota archaeon]|nr:MAG: carboxypeptidase regulatory-like domain-containing protein [Euryarchaeota archaeon]
MDTINIRVVDSDNFVVPNATVWLKYQRTATVGTVTGPSGSTTINYVETKKVKTNLTGDVSLSVVNQEKDPNKVDCNIQINVDYFGIVNKETLNIDAKPQTYYFKIDTKRVPVSVLSDGKPIEAELVFSNGIELSVPKSGTAISLPIGKVEGYAIMRELGLKKFFSENVDSNYKALVISFQKVPYSLSVFDERDNPVAFSMKIGNETLSSVGGTLTTRLFNIEYDAILYIEGNSIPFIVKPELGQQTYYIDLHAPEISSLDILGEENGKLNISFKVEDVGKHVSGVASVSAYDGLKKLPISSSENLYVVSMDAPTKDSPKIVTIEVVDGRGNKRIEKVKFTYSEVVGQQVQQVKENAPKKDGLLSTLLLIIVVVLVAIILYVIKIMYF